MHGLHGGDSGQLESSPLNAVILTDVDMNSEPPTTQASPVKSAAGGRGRKAKTSVDDSLTCVQF